MENEELMLDGGVGGHWEWVVNNQDKYVDRYFEKNLNNNTKSHIFLNDIKLATINNDDNPYYIISDHLNSSNLLTTSSGTIAEVEDYKPYGTTNYQNTIEDLSDNYGFSGKEVDEETNTQYFVARYDDNNTARFSSIDPALLVQPQNFILDPQQLNSYSYTANNPLRYIDPSGKYRIETSDQDKTTLTIEKGDTLSHVAQFFNMNYNDLAKQLNISDPNKIREGSSYDVTPLMLGSIMVPLSRGYSVRIDAPRAGTKDQFNAHLYKRGNQLDDYSQDLYGNSREGKKDFGERINKELENNKKWQNARARQERWESDHKNDKNNGASAGGGSGAFEGDSMISPGTNFFFLPIMGAPMPIMFNMPSLISSPVLLAP